MFQIHFWYYKVHNNQNKVENIDIRCINCEKNWFIYEKYEYQLQRYNQLVCVEYSVTPCWYAMDNLKKTTFGIWYEKKSILDNRWSLV